jgi:hypothetical protein
VIDQKLIGPGHFSTCTWISPRNPVV